MNPAHPAVGVPDQSRHRPSTLDVLAVSDRLTGGRIEEPEEQLVVGTVSRLGDRVAFSVAETAMITGLSRDLLYDQMRVGKLSYLKVGRRRIITRRNLEAFLGSPWP
jgi:excisionase family DNA binding protein